MVYTQLRANIFDTRQRRGRIRGEERDAMFAINHLLRLIKLLRESRGDEVANYPEFTYSKNELKKAGKALSGDLIWTPESRDDHVRIFKVAYDWRNSHAYPLHKVRQELLANIRRGKKKGITAARMKRMASIRRKLRLLSTKLDQMQDIAGCRAIMQTVPEMQQLVAMYHDGIRTGVIKRSTDYIASPRVTGYRGHHFIVEFQSREAAEASYDGRKVEIQIRTKLQHAWSTAVEAVGLVLKEELKSGEGSGDWLRFFALMSSEFAIEEGCPIVPGTPKDEAERRKELRELSDKLGAVKFLETLNQALKYTEYFVGAYARYFLIQYDSAKKEVRVSSYSQIEQASSSYATAESGGGSVNSVLVEVDQAASLKDAYPNYFLDVEMFTDRLKQIVFNQRRASNLVSGGIDLSWLKDWGKKKG
ncbi:RelA/SpoT domain-containing protein [Brucella anthropi]|uniref:RelA/SpoT domain-containing protein n=1 Tax=Brucella anthropi TaxID=529 RepID=UPI0006845E1F|nr:RelA/SpoT domain-containing protein [Brucella anthropi]